MNLTNASDLANLTRAEYGSAYIFTISFEAALDNYNGTVESIQYCYHQTSNISMERKIDILTLMQNGTEFIVDRNITLQSSGCHCALTNYSHCEEVPLEDDDFQITSMNVYTFGVLVSPNIQPLTLATEYDSDQYQLSVGNIETLHGILHGEAFRLDNQVNLSSVSLLRFSIRLHQEMITNGNYIIMLISLVYSPSLFFLFFLPPAPPPAI